MGVQDEYIFHVQRTVGGAVNSAGPKLATMEQQAYAAIVLNFNDSPSMHVIVAASARDSWGRLSRFNHTQDMASLCGSRRSSRRLSIRRRI